MPCRFRDDRGTVTAEVAIALPAVILVLVFALGALATLGAQVRLQGAVGSAARILGSGGTDAAAPVTSAVAGASVTEVRRGDVVCAIGSASVGVWFVPVTIRATACSLDDAQ
jgi:Flp pilus assembly protein TadG